MWTPRQLTSSVTILLLLTVAGADSQRSDRSAEGPLETLRVNVNLVTIGVRVSDRRNREVSGLKQEEFSVFEDGRQQQIAVFASEQQPVSVLILLDRSYSMGQSGKPDQAKSALTQLLANSHPDNEYALVVFDNESIPLLDFSADRQRIGSLLGRIGSVGRAPAFTIRWFWPSIVLTGRVTLGTFSSSSPTAPTSIAGFVWTMSSRGPDFPRTGVSGWVSRSKEDAVFRESGKTVTLISGQEIDNPRYVFKHLAVESGAERYFPESGEELATAVRTIAQDLRAQYTLGYYTSPSDRGMQYRRIEVKVRPRGLRVRARHGFLSLGDDETELPVSAVPVRPSGAETIQQRTLPYEIKTERRDGQVIFREDFSDAASGWPQKPGFFLKEGRYHLEQLRLKAFNEGRVAANGPWWTDFEASVVVEFQSGQKDFHSMPPAAGLVFRLNERGYYALVISRPAGFAKVYYKPVEKFHTAAAHDLLFWDQEWRPDPGRLFQHKLGVVCRGSLIQLYVDGLRVRELRDESFSDGIVGTVLFGEGHAVFDDLLAQSIVDRAPVAGVR